jgi:hypothetical protein
MAPMVSEGREINTPFVCTKNTLQTKLCLHFFLQSMGVSKHWAILGFYFFIRHEYVFSKKITRHKPASFFTKIKVNFRVDIASLGVARLAPQTCSLRGGASGGGDD